jgi:hypothetical protein
VLTDADIDRIIARMPPGKPIYMRRVDGATGEVLSVDAIHHGEGWTFYEFPGVTNAE